MDISVLHFLEKVQTPSSVCELAMAPFSCAIFYQFSPLPRQFIHTSWCFSLCINICQTKSLDKRDRNIAEKILKRVSES